MSETTIDDAPDTPALDAWYEAHHRYGPDRPNTMLWYPREAPYATLQVRERGCDLSPVLNDPTKPHAHLRLGGNITLGGLLSDLEDYVAAMRDALKFARWQADQIAVEMEAEALRVEDTTEPTEETPGE